MYTDIIELFKDMKISGSRSFLTADIVPTVGWICQRTEKEYRISLVDFSNSIKLSLEEDKKFIRDNFWNNRQNVLLILDSLPSLQKLDNLKSFW